MCHRIQEAVSILFRLFKNWLMIRGVILGAMWAVVGSSAYELVLHFVPTEGEKVLERFHEFADPFPVILLFVAGTALVGAFSFVFRKLFQAGRSGWSEAIADEISDAATNFACISVVVLVWAWKNGSTPGVLDILLIVGMVFVAFLSCKEEEISRIKATDFGFKITRPVRDGMEVDEHTEFTGEAKYRVPDGFEAWIIRRFVGYEAEFYPMMRIHLVSKLDEPGFMWMEKKVFVGGQPTHGRRFEVWIVGRETALLFRHYKAWNDYLHFEVKEGAEELKKAGLISRPIKEEIEDGVRVATRIVTRR
jgi:hypothetical protein